MGRCLGVVMKSLGGFLKITFCSLINVGEFLRVAIDQGEPGALDVDHDSMALPEGVVGVGHCVAHLCYFSGCEWLRFCEAVAEFSSNGLSTNELLVASHVHSFRIWRGIRIVA